MFTLFFTEETRLLYYKKLTISPYLFLNCSLVKNKPSFGLPYYLIYFLRSFGKISIHHSENALKRLIYCLPTLSRCTIATVAPLHVLIFLLPDRTGNGRKPFKSRMETGGWVVFDAQTSIRRYVLT